MPCLSGDCSCQARWTAFMTVAPLQRLIIPLTLAVAALFLRNPAQSVPVVYHSLLTFVPYIVLGMVLLLSLYNNRARLFTAGVALVLIYYLIQHELQVSLVEFRAWFIYTSMSVCIPLTLLLLFFIPERGLRNRFGLFTVMTVLVQVLFAAGIFLLVPLDELSGFMNRYFAIRLHPRYLLSFYASICFAMVLLAGLVQLYRDRTEATAALAGVLVMCWIVLACFYLEGISLVLFTAMGLTLFVSMLRSSHAMAYRDDLTGLLGRRALNERLKSLGKRYVIAMMDVDHFKSFNDTWGHDVGDDVLKMVARQVDSVKGGGTAYRYGGEEFCIVFAGKSIEECKPFLEAVRARIEAYKMILRDAKNRSRTEKSVKERRGRRRKNRSGKTVSVTISIGVSAPDEKNDKPESVIKAADSALYKAKKKGRNCLVTT